MDFEWRRLLGEMIKVILADESSFPEFLEYMKTEMENEEYATLSEYSSDLSERHPSWEFIDAYKGLALKYPKETKGYQMKSFIDEAEYIVECRLGERKQEK